MFDPLNFDSPSLIEIPVTIGGKKYVLREADEEAASKYRGACAARARFNDEGKFAGADSKIGETQALLVSLCLYELLPNGEYRQTPISDVRALPSRIVRQLFDKAKEVSDLTEKDAAREELSKALGLDASPVKLEKLQEFVAGLPGYDKLKAWVRPTAEERAKNSPNATTDGSE